MGQRTTHSKLLFNNGILPENYFPPIIIGYNIKTPENMGNIIRLADNVGCQEVFFITDNKNQRESKIKKTASSSFNSVKWSFCDIMELQSEIPKDYIWIGVETSSDSKNIFSSDLPQKVAVVVGNEINGIDSKILDMCEKIVHIPLVGNNTSMNVSHALAVAIFEWQRRQLKG
ncbi:MAG: TrmH family RNA methyltransferase [Marinilabiliales bacterium]|nr:MAG: TrmH family RNA methyltransferase [Marinilabiliales bacterium]